MGYILVFQSISIWCVAIPRAELIICFVLLRSYLVVKIVFPSSRRDLSRDLSRNYFASSIGTTCENREDNMAVFAEVKIYMNTLHLVSFSRLGKSRNHDIHKFGMNAALVCRLV
jgi:hypothetical protein